MRILRCFCHNHLTMNFVARLIRSSYPLQFFFPDRTLLSVPNNLSWGFICHFYSCFARHPFWPWVRWVNHFIYKQCLIQIAESFLVPLLGYLIYAIYKHGARFGRQYLTSFILYTLGTPVPSHFWIYLGLLLNWPLHTFRDVWVHIIWSVPVGVEPFHTVYGGVSAPPALHRGVGPNVCLSCDLSRHTRTRGRCIPFGIIWASRAVKWRLFLIRSVRIILVIIKFSYWGHESHWWLLPWIFISWLCRS